MSVLGPQWSQQQPQYFQPKLSQEDDWRIAQRQQWQNRSGTRVVPGPPDNEIDWNHYEHQR